MSIKTEVWGNSPKGKPVHKFTLTNAMGASVSVIEWGAILTSIIVPDAGGNMDDVALGFDSLVDLHAGVLRKLGIRIPEDLSVVGFYDTAGPESGLTTFNIQEHVIASTATEMLFEDSSEYKKIYVKPELILRESVRKL